jgi:hypothetical protein
MNLGEYENMDYVIAFGFFAACAVVNVGLFISYLLLVGKITSPTLKFVLSQAGYLSCCIGMILPIVLIDQFSILKISKENLFGSGLILMITFIAVFWLFMRKYKTRLKSLGFYAAW